MKKSEEEEGNLTPKTIKKLWITGSHRVQNISEWKNNESTTLAYTGKATYKKLDKKGKVTTHGACIDIYQDDTMLKKCYKSDRLNIFCMKLAHTRLKILMHLLNVFLYVISIFVMTGGIDIYYSVPIGVLWLLIPIHIFSVLNYQVGRRIWRYSLLPWIHFSIALLETIAFCDVCQWDLRVFVVGPPMLLTQVNIVNFDGVYFKREEKYIVIMKTLFSIFWKLIMLGGLRFNYFENMHSRNMFIITIEDSHPIYFNNVSLYVSKTLSMTIFLVGSILFKLKQPQRAYALRTHYTIKTNREWNEINRKIRIKKRETLKTSVKNMRNFLLEV